MAIAIDDIFADTPYDYYASADAATAIADTPRRRYYASFLSAFSQPPLPAAMLPPAAPLFRQLRCFLSPIAAA
jgi:hypothetical protein